MFSHCRGCSIGAPVVDDEDLEAAVRILGRRSRFDGFQHHRSLVVGGDDHRHRRRVGERGGRRRPIAEPEHGPEAEQEHARRRPEDSRSADRAAQVRNEIVAEEDQDDGAQTADDGRTDDPFPTLVHVPVDTGRRSAMRRETKVKRGRSAEMREAGVELVRSAEVRADQTAARPANR